MTTRRRMSRRAIGWAGGALGLAALALGLLTSTAATADTPTAAVAEFHARCDGATEREPTNGDGPNGSADNTLVFGKRLAAYNAGAVVPLYDNWGDSALSYPPLCGVRYVEAAGGPVTAWMYCTDAEAKVCADATPDGGLTHPAMPGVDLNFPTLLSSNPALTPDQNAVIGYVIQNGHSYVEAGTQTYADATTTASRSNLQTLVWCISDSDVMSARGKGPICEQNMSPAEQARLLALIPEPTTVILDVSAVPGDLAVNDTARITVSTNAYGVPIALATDPAADIVVCSGNATLSGGMLTVAGADPSIATDIELCLTSGAPGRINVSAIVHASDVVPSSKHILWNQSQGNGPDAVPCQVFATFGEDEIVDVAGQAAVTFAAKPSTPTTTQPSTPTTTQPSTPTTTEPSTPTTTEPSTPTTTEPSTPTTTQPSTPTTAPAVLASTGATVMQAALIGLALFLGGGLVLAMAARRIPGAHR